MAELLAGVTLKNRNGEELDAATYLKGKVVGLYFSASWCPPCRAFTPILKQFYEKMQLKHPEFEVIFVSRDRAAEDLQNYFADHMGSWVYIPFGSEKIQELLKQYEVKTIPSMRVIKPNGDVVVQDARTAIQEKCPLGQDITEAVEDLYEEWLAFYES